MFCTFSKCILNYFLKISSTFFIKALTHLDECNIMFNCVKGKLCVAPKPRRYVGLMFFCFHLNSIDFENREINYFEEHEKLFRTFQHLYMFRISFISLRRNHNEKFYGKPIKH